VSKVRPYLFWIICGAIILVELVLLLFISPTGKDGHSPAEVKTDLDNRNKELDALFLKAKAGSPAGREFDAENDKDIKDLTSNWLATPAWKPVLDAHVDGYATQIVKIRDYLVARSQPLHRSISSERGRFEWYSQYEGATAELLQKLYENQCLVVPKPQGASMPTTGGAAAPPGAATTATSGGDAAEAGEIAPDFRKISAARTVAGFLTTTQYPDPERFDELTTQFRVMELVASALIEAKATNDPSPIRPGAPSEAHAQLVATNWRDATDEAISVQLTLQGPLSALLAAEAALEENQDDAQPIKVVTGSSLARKAFFAGERRDLTSEPAILKVTLAVLDFSSKKDEQFILPTAAPASPPKARAKAAAPASEKPATTDGE
jgi:hypothetical protein